MFEEKIRKLIKTHIMGLYSKVSLIPGKCRLNRRCHQNSVHDAIKKNYKEISMGFCVSDDDIFIHFVNLNKNGDLQDNTLGVWSSNYDYYHVKFILEDDFMRITDVFIEYRKHLKHILPWYLKPFYKDNIV